MWTPGPGLGWVTEQELLQEPFVSSGSSYEGGIDHSSPLGSSHAWAGSWALPAVEKRGAPAVIQPSRAELPAGPQLALGGICPRTEGVTAEAHLPGAGECLGAAVWTAPCGTRLRWPGWSQWGTGAATFTLGLPAPSWGASCPHSPGPQTQMLFVPLSDLQATPGTHSHLGQPQHLHGGQWVRAQRAGLWVPNLHMWAVDCVRWDNQRLWGGWGAAVSGCPGHRLWENAGSSPLLAI